MVVGRSPPVPDPLIFSRKTMVSGPGSLVFRHRARYFRLELDDGLVFLGRN